jgi:hypothetical protein
MANKHEFPVYIISKGRFDNPITANHFEKANIDYLIAVEPQEYDLYCNKLGINRVLKLPFANLGLGSFPARNFCWEHAKSKGYKYHWLFDDNIQGIAKWENGKKIKCENIDSALIFIENYTKKNNIDINGFEYRYFVMKSPKTPFKTNCHVYSALLIRNNLPYRWRLKYNEDVDLCLQVLHNGGKTASCVYYMANKVSTSQKMKGGNQTELYKGNAPVKNLLKATMLQKVWPQYVKVVIRFGRHHHLIDWKQFKKNEIR